MQLRERVVAAAIALTSEVGWSALTMQALADRVGVSRQTIYNEVGSRAALASTMVLAELARFLGFVDDAFAAHPEDLPAAIEQSLASAEREAATSALLQSIIAGAHGPNADLVPLISTDGGELFSIATAQLARHMSGYDHGLAPGTVNTLAEVIVRVAVSQAMSPGPNPGETASVMGWLVARAVDNK